MQNSTFFSKLRTSVAPLLLVACFAAPALAAPDRLSKVKNDDEVTAPAQGEGTSLFGSYLSGRFASGNGDLSGASGYFSHVLDSDPQNPDLIVQAMRLALTDGKVEQAIAHAKKLKGMQKTGEKDDMLVNSLLGIDAVKKKDFAGAQKILDVPEAQGFNAVIIPLLDLWTQIGQESLKEPVNMDEIAAAAGTFSPFVNYHVALADDVAGFKAEAEKNYQKATTSALKMPYRVMEAFANFYQRSGQPDKAKALIEDYQRANPEVFLIEGERVGNNDPALATDKNAVVPQALVKNATEGVAEIYFAIATILYSSDAPMETLAYLNMTLYLRPDFPSAQLMRGSIYEQLDRPARAIAVYNQVPPTSALYGKARQRVAFNLDQLGKTDEALHVLEDISQKFPTRSDPYITRGDILRGHERYAESIEAYSEAIERLPKLQSYHWPVFYVRGIAYERAGEWKKAEADLRRALQLQPGQAEVLNYLGYSMLVQGQNVGEAREMIEEAISSKPEDAQIVDSMGWALYLMGSFDESLDYLERAADLMPGEMAINDHLADAYWRVGRQAEARFQWDKALAFAETEKDKKILRQKIASGLPEFVPLKKAKPTDMAPAAKPKEAPAPSQPKAP